MMINCKSNLELKSDEQESNENLLWLEVASEPRRL